MSIEKVRAYFEHFVLADRIREFDVSSATVELAAVAVGVEGARIAASVSVDCAGLSVPLTSVRAIGTSSARETALQSSSA